MRVKRHKATRSEREYVESLAHFAQNVETDGLSLYWSEEGTLAEFSTQYPSEDGWNCFFRYQNRGTNGK